MGYTKTLLWAGIATSILLAAQTSESPQTILLGTSTIAKWPNTGFGKGTIRYPHPGQTTRELLQDAKKIRHKTVIIYTGDNDLTKTSRSQTQQNIKILIQTLTNNKNQTYLLTPKTAPARKNWSDQIQQLQWWEQNLTSSFPNLTVINTNMCNQPQNFAPDGIHYNTNGYQCITQQIKNQTNKQTPNTTPEYGNAE